MRDAFCNTMVELAAADPRLVLISADLGFGIFNEFVERFPNQFLNVGVAEQSMIGVATGMALSGWTVFAYSIGNFPTLRCLEQIRNDAAYHEANVNIVCSGGGFTYGNLGMSHHATEDLSIMRSVPGVTVVAPCDAWEAQQATRALASRPGVGYLRLEKNVAHRTERPGERFEIGKARRLREGEDVTLIAAGGIMAHALKAADELAKTGISARVVSMHTLSPIDQSEIVSAMRSTRAIVTIEENIISGGLGGAVAEFVAENAATLGFGGLFRRVALRQAAAAIVGDQEYLRSYYGIDCNAIVSTVRSLVNAPGLSPLPRAGSERGLA